MPRNLNVSVCSWIPSLDTEGNQSDCPSIQLVIFMVIMPGGEGGGRGQSGSCTLETLSPSFFFVVVCFLMHTDEGSLLLLTDLSHTNLFTNMTLAVTIYIGSQPSKVSHNHHTPTHVLYPSPTPIISGGHRTRTPYLQNSMRSIFNL